MPFLLARGFLATGQALEDLKFTTAVAPQTEQNSSTWNMQGTEAMLLQESLSDYTLCLDFVGVQRIPVMFHANFKLLTCVAL
jgi:hypothetical protein